MFNLQDSELIIILLLALVVLGPEKLPDAMRKAGQFYAELKKMSTGFQTEFRSVIDEPLKELRETANTIRDSADFTKLQNSERPEKPKSAEMAAAADPDAVPSSDLPVQPGGDDDAGGRPPVEPPADVAPGDQEPFASVVLTNRAIDPPADPDGAAGTPATVTKMAPVAFSGRQVSSAGPPTRVPKPADPPSVGDADPNPTDPNPTDPNPTDPNPARGAASDAAPVDPDPADQAASDDPVERSGDPAGTESSE